MESGDIGVNTLVVVTLLTTTMNPGAIPIAQIQVHLLQDIRHMLTICRPLFSEKIPYKIPQTTNAYAILICTEGNTFTNHT